MQEQFVNAAEPTSPPYYTPTPNSQVVPPPFSTIPSSPTLSPSPVSPLPADRRPQLNPLPQRPNSIQPNPIRSTPENSAVRLMTPHTEVSLREELSTIEMSKEPILELLPPQLAPQVKIIGDSVSEELEQVPELLNETFDDRTAATSEISDKLVPVAWSLPVKRDNQIPARDIWDDEGWRSLQ